MADLREVGVGPEHAREHAPEIDRPGAVRPGEELDARALDAYLKQLEPSLVGELEIAQFPGGASNLTYLLRYPGRELVLRRPPFGHKAKGAHDMIREAQLMRALAPVYPYVPKVLAICGESEPLGSEFYVMERLLGVIPRRELPGGLQLDPDRARALCLSVIDRLIELHRVDYRARGLAGLGKGEGYVARQIRGWSERYRRACTPDVPAFSEVMAWLERNMPARDVATCLIHNDFRLDNVVLDPADPLRVIGVLDWELATLGDPLMDLGNTLAYWIEAGDPAWRQESRLQPTHLPGMLSRREVIEYYSAQTGFGAESYDFYELYGLFRLAAILQQIYYRYFHRQTRNPAFARFGVTVGHLHEECLRRIAARGDTT
jgi:aminoglycoside phosphotransferase (APT) family kinase protein